MSKSITFKPTLDNILQRVSSDKLNTWYYNFFDVLAQNSGSVDLEAIGCNPTKDYVNIVTEINSTMSNVSKSTGLSCKMCGCVFEKVEIQRKHFKSDWHRLNLKFKQTGKRCVSESEAYGLLCESVGESDESLSGSGDSSGDEVDSDVPNGSISENEFLSHKLENANVMIDLQKGLVATCWTSTIKNKLELQQYIKNAEENKPRKWTILLYTAGHFAGAVFENEKVIRSKTFHRYVVRQKQGGAQSRNDNSKGKAKSAGATIRRYNEQLLTTEIKDLIESWRSQIESCSHIFLSASKRNRPTLFQAPDIINPKDTRVRNVPFPVKRPTLNEVKRTIARLSLAKFTLQKSTIETFDTTNNTPIKNELQVEDNPVVPEDIPVGTNHDIDDLSNEFEDLEIHTMCKTNTAIEQMDEWVSGFESSETLLHAINVVGKDGQTPLHLATANGYGDVVEKLLTLGADPAKRDIRGRLPFNIAPNKNMRTVYRLFRGKAPDKYDYEAAAIPEAITQEAEEAKKKKQREKKKRQAAKRKLEKAKQKKIAEKQENDRLERLRLEAEAAQKCSNCDKALIGSPNDFFYRLEFVYCSSNCMQTHRRALMAEAAERRMQR